jgi:hypothetical protein
MVWCACARARPVVPGPSKACSPGASYLCASPPTSLRYSHNSRASQTAAPGRASPAASDATRQPVQLVPSAGWHILPYCVLLQVPSASPHILCCLISIWLLPWACLSAVALNCISSAPATVLYNLGQRHWCILPNSFACSPRPVSCLRQSIVTLRPSIKNRACPINNLVAVHAYMENRSYDNHQGCTVLKGLHSAR